MFQFKAVPETWESMPCHFQTAFLLNKADLPLREPSEAPLLKEYQH